MSKVDWSLAPEGATHWDASDFRINSFMKFDGAKWFYWPPASSEKHWCRWGDNSNQDVNGMIERPTAKPWSGPEDGLPPVGAPCQAELYGGGGWIEGFVAYYGKAHFIFESGQLTVGVEISGKIRNAAFRAIKTPEQLAAEEREIGITSLVNASSSDDFPGISRFHAAQIYDAGFKREVK